jgi:cell division inhibitor SepF
MASFMNKALAYLGLKDIEDDDLYGEEYDADETPPRRVGHTVYPEHDLDEQPETRTFGGVVRPLSAEDPTTGSFSRSAIVRPLVPNRNPNAKVHVVMPSRFAEAQEIGDIIKDANPVIVNLQVSDRDLARRLIDFCAGLTYALGGQMEKVAEQVFLLTPSNVEVSAEEKLRLQERGLYRP